MKNRVYYTLIMALLLFSAVTCACAKAESQKGAQSRKIGTITIFGNSIVAHDPAPSIGWNGDWGMAASCRDSDFVHIIEKHVAVKSRLTKVAWGNLAAFERDYATYDLSQLEKYGQSDMVIVKISENVKYEAGMEATFIASYDRLINTIAAPTSVVIVVEGFWPTPINDMMRRYAERKGYPFVRLSDLFADDKSNAAIGLFENEGVANHPSDKGMRNIAARIIAAIDGYKLK